ncbi:MAG: amidohydrolase [Oscillospiraceae bacterium]|nr:amidohydrolase [Oscillospiraceae bacterium]
MYIYNAKICSPDAAPIESGYVKISEGKIAAVKKGKPGRVTPDSIDAGGKFLYPGFIDCHTHLGILGGGADDGDLNESSDPVTPHLRAIDGFNFTDECFKDAVKAGVTSVVTGVGSSNPIGGESIAIKTHGKCADDMFIRKSGIKFALGENPKRTYSAKGQSPRTRMATAAIIREALFKAKSYKERISAAGGNLAKMPAYDIKSEALIPVLNREIKAFFHCHRADDIMTAVRIAKEFALDYVLVHCTAGHTVAELLGKENVTAVIGPVIGGRDKRELAEHTVSNAGILYNSGVKVAVCTDHSELPVQYLCTGAAYCVKAGLPRDEALKAITINAAETAGISDRAGSITIGKDADLILLDGDPFDIMTNVVMTMIEGEVVYSQLMIDD